MLEVEVYGAPSGTDTPAAGEIHSLCARAAASRGVSDGHVAIEFVDAARIAELNERHRGRAEPTDVLSFPIDELAVSPPAGAAAEGAPAPPRELGDVLICAEHTADLREAIVHGMLHLLGMDHERDDGEMLALQHELLARAQR